MMKRWHFLMVKKEVKTVYDFSDEVLDEIKKKYPTLNDTPIDKVIMEKYQQILSARYNESQANNKTDRKSTRLNSSHSAKSRMPSSA